MRLPVPAVLGHEGAGTVVSVGEGVTGVAPGDEVVLNWAPSCGACPACARGEVWLCGSALDGAARVHAHRADDGTELHPGLNVAAFAEETVVPRSCVLPAPAGVPLTDAALLGCAVLTGYGAVHHAARVRPGETVAVFGVGGVGLAALQSARIAGASTIVAVDVSPDKEGLARAAGATDYLVASDTTPRQIRALTGKQGVDVAVECVGRAVTIRTAWESTRRGGRTTVVGIGGKDQPVTFNALEIFHGGRTLPGRPSGHSDPPPALPRPPGAPRPGRLRRHARRQGSPRRGRVLARGRGAGPPRTGARGRPSRRAPALRLRRPGCPARRPTRPRGRGRAPAARPRPRGRADRPPRSP